MNFNIEQLNKIKLYYPFLNDNNGINEPIRKEIKFLVGYLLLVDIIIIPPRSLFGGFYGTENINTINSSNIFQHLISTGRIVTTSSTSAIRDFSDLIEYYSSGNIKSSNTANLIIYNRDAHAQKNHYALKMSEHLNDKKYYPEQLKHDFNVFLNNKPNHQEILDKINSLQEFLHPAELDRLRSEAMHCYFGAGAFGNGAILPSMYMSDLKINIYNPFYSKDAVCRIINKFQKITKANINTLSIPQIEKTLNHAGQIRIKYHEISTIYNSYYNRILPILNHGAIRTRLPLDIPYVLMSVFLSTMASILLNNPWVCGVSIPSTYFVKVSWAYINRIMKVTENLTKKLVDFLRSVGIYDEYRKDLVVFNEEFESQVRKSIGN